jgi:hypothetical protein
MIKIKRIAHLKKEKAAPDHRIALIDRGRARKATRGAAAGFMNEFGFPPFNRYPA